MAIQPVSIDRISPVSSVPAVSKISADSNTRTIRAQINSKQQHMKKISSDDTITATEKEEKRRQLQKEIDELNRKLELKKQEQEEKAKEAAKKQEQASALKDELLKKDIQKEDSLKELESDTQPAEKDTKAETEEPKHVDMPVSEIQEMLSSEYLVQKEQLQEQVDTKAENAIRVVKSEISQDKIYGSDTTKKETELEALQQKQNFWSDAQKQTKELEIQENKQIQTQNTTLNQNAKVIIDQI